VYAYLERGWLDGVRQVRAVRERLRMSWERGVRVLRFATLEMDDEALVVDSEEAMEGLVDIKRSDADDVWKVDTLVHRSPVFCLAGSGEDSEHPHGCAHTHARQVWEDDQDS